MTTENPNNQKEKKIVVSSEYDKTLAEMHGIANHHAQEIKNYLWDKFTVDGLSPILIRKACDDVIALIEKKENEYIEKEENEDDIYPH